MPKVNVYNMLGEKVREIELSDNVFGIEVNNMQFTKLLKII